MYEVHTSIFVNYPKKLHRDMIEILHFLIRVHKINSKTINVEFLTNQDVIFWIK